MSDTNKPESRVTQKKRILAVLRTGRCPSTLELIKEYNIVKPSNRVGDLIKDGHLIESIPCKAKNADGVTVRFVRYQLHE